MSIDKFKEYFPDSKPLLGDKNKYTDQVVPRHFTKEGKHFKNLFSDVFAHHADYSTLDEPDQIQVDTSRAHRIIQKEDITALFRYKYISDFKISNTPNSSDEDINDNIVIFSEFKDEVLDPPIHIKQINQGKTNLCFVTGTVGQGKSLLVINLKQIICDERKKPDSTGQNLKCLPVYFDIEIDWQRKGGRIEDISERFYTMLLDKIKKEVLLLSVDGIINLKIDSEAPEKTAIEQIEIISIGLPKYGYYLMLIIDNIDRWYFENTRYSFFMEYMAELEDSIEKNIECLYNLFQNGGGLGRISAVVLIVCRKEVINSLQRYHDGVNLQDKWPIDTPVYQVLGIPAKEIVSNRLKLLKECIEVIEKEAPEYNIENYQNAVKILERATNKVSASEEEMPELMMSILEYINILSHQGLRSFIGFISRLALDSRDNCEVIERVLVTQPRNLLRLYITNLYKRYQQSENHFPNLFLNDARIKPDDCHSKAHASHRQTYWLKYITLKFIQFQPSRNVEFGILRDYLCETCGYEDHLVRLVVGSLCTPHHFKCIDVKYASEELVRRNLKLSTRGNALIGDPLSKSQLLNKPFCFSFDYLQLMIDDPWLRYPKDWANKIAISEGDIGHTLKPKKIYIDGSKKNLSKKIPAILQFFRVLIASWNTEYEHRIRKLPEDMISYISPNFEFAKNELFLGIKNVLYSFDHEGQELYSNMEKSWDVMIQDQRYEKWWADFYNIDLFVDY